MKKAIIILLLLNSFAYLRAQQRPATSVWLTMQGHINFSEKWQWHNDAGYRTFGISAEPIQYLYRTGIRYHFNNKWSTAGGVAFFFTKADFDKSHNEFGDEFRFWEEMVYHQPLNKNLQLLLRFRTEQRFFAATSLKDEYTGYRFRLRPGLNQKINEKWSLQLTNEFMQQAANGRFSFDQNRITFSGIYHFNKATLLQAGYLWLMWPGDDQHILTVTLTKNFSWHGDN